MSCSVMLTVTAGVLVVLADLPAAGDPSRQEWSDRVCTRFGHFHNESRWQRWDNSLLSLAGAACPRARWPGSSLPKLS